MSVEKLRIIYCSEVSPEFKREGLVELIRTSVVYNKQFNVTGILLCNGEYFFQVLEGDDQKIKALFAKICLDSRHGNLKKLSEKSTVRRLFPKWSMELIDEDNDFFQETYGSSFNPYEFSEKRALECAMNAKAWRMRRLQMG